MKLEITCKNYRLTEGLREVITKKIQKLDKYFPEDDASVKVVLTKQNKTTKMEISINYGGTPIRAEVEGKTMYYNIDTIMPKLEKQILKYREKIYQKRKQPVDIGQSPEFIAPSDMPIVRSEDYEIAKTKKFAIEAIELKEAIVNLELTGHDFYLFLNTATNQVEAVYRRHDGTIGHLQPYLA